MKKFKNVLLLLLIFVLMTACNTETAATEALSTTEAATTEAMTSEGETETATTSVSAMQNLAGVNAFLNDVKGHGEGSISNPIAVVPFAHIDGPKNEDPMYAFVNFKYVARDYVKYQISYISCTCRSADVNYWTTAYIELSLPGSKNIDDAVIEYISFEKDKEDKYTVGFWGDSDPIPNGTTYNDLKEQYIPFFVGKTIGDIKQYNTMDDIVLADYQEGDGRSGYTLDAFSGASVSTNNFIRMIHAIGEYHGTDPYFGGSTVEVVESTETATTEEAATTEATGGQTVSVAELPAPVDTTKTFKPSNESEDTEQCAVDSTSPGCGSINAENLTQYLGRNDVYYIDLRDYEDYAAKHLRNFEVIPFFAYIWNAEANTNPDMIQLYGGDLKDPEPVYEESDQILEFLFPKDKTLFLMCQSGGRVGMMMDILAARGWDMSKVYNIGGLAQYSVPEYRDMTVEMPEFVLDINYNLEGLTRVE